MEGGGGLVGRLDDRQAFVQDFLIFVSYFINVAGECRLTYG